MQARVRRERKEAKAPAKPNAPAAARADTFRVVDRVMALLGHLARHADGLTLTQISLESGLHKATASRFLKALHRGRFVAQSATGKAWRLGPAFFEIGARTFNQTDLRAVARPVMDRLCRQFGETIQLAMLADDAVVYLEKVEPPDAPLKINTQTGSRRPIHCTGLGKAIAAYREWTDVAAILDRAGMKRMTSQSIVDPARFRAELALVRKRGFATDNREYNDLVVCVAAPVRNASGEVVAGLSVSTFGVSLASARFRLLTKGAMRAADEVSSALGWRTPMT